MDGALLALYCYRALMPAIGTGHSDTPATKSACPWRSCVYDALRPSRIRKYFDHIDKSLDLSKDSRFNTPVNTAHWNEKTKRWDVSAGKDNDVRVSCQYLILCMVRSV